MIGNSRRSCFAGCSCENQDATSSGSFGDVNLQPRCLSHTQTPQRFKQKLWAIEAPRTPKLLAPPGLYATVPLVSLAIKPTADQYSAGDWQPRRSYFGTTAVRCSTTKAPTTRSKQRKESRVVTGTLTKHATASTHGNSRMQPNNMRNQICW